MPDGAAAAAAQGSQRWKAVLAWALVAAWAVVIFVMSAHTGDDLSQGDDLIARVKQWLEAVSAQLFGPDVDAVSSLAHFCEFTVLGALLANALGRHIEPRERWLMVLGLAVAAGSAYAITDEVHQIFVPGRVCDVLDWLVDTAGTALGAGIWLLIGRKRAQHRFPSADDGE